MINYFESLLKSYDGDSKEVREDIKQGLMDSKQNAITVAEYLLEALQDETKAELEDTPEDTHTKIYRLMEINNITQCVKGYRDMIEAVTQDKFDGWMERIYNLITNPSSFGKHELTK